MSEIVQSTGRIACTIAVAAVLVVATSAGTVTAVPVAGHNQTQVAFGADAPDQISTDEDHLLKTCIPAGATLSVTMEWNTSKATPSLFFVADDYVQRGDHTKQVWEATYTNDTVTTTVSGVQNSVCGNVTVIGSAPGTSYSLTITTSAGTHVAR